MQVTHLSHYPHTDVHSPSFLGEVDYIFFYLNSKKGSTGSKEHPS